MANNGSGNAPAWELKDLEGKTVRSSDLQGKVVLLNFWATWCPPCREEIPDLVALQNQYKEQGLVIVGISLDQTGPETVKRFADRMKINYPVVMGNQEVAAAYGGIQAIPTTVFINRDGKIAGKYEGGVTKEMLEPPLKPLLQKTNL